MTGRGPGWRRYGARALLLVGIAVAALELAPAVPREHGLVFELDDPRQVRRLDATWTDLGASEPRGGVTLRFDRPPPRRIRHAVTLPHGNYVLTIDVERRMAGATRQTTHTRRVSLQGGETTIVLTEGP